MNYKNFPLLLPLLATLAACHDHSGGGTGQQPPPSTPPPTLYSLEVSLEGSGTGSVSSAPTGVNCGIDCTENYASGAAVTLTATADSDSTFARWSGAGCTGTGACVVTMSASTSVTATFNAIPPIVTHVVGGTVSGLAGSVVLQNNGGNNLSITSAGSFAFPTTINEGDAYDVTILTQPASQTCTVSNGAGTIGNGDVTNIVVSCANNVTTLELSADSLALAVNNTALNPALTGIARVLTVTNSGMSPATGLAISNSGLALGTTQSSSCSSTLAPGASCTITVSPGSNASSSCETGIAPTVGSIVVSAGNAMEVTSNVVTLTYGCQHQGGFIYSIDDTTPNTGSIGGKVVSLTDQAASYFASGPQATSIVWSSNGLGSTGANASEDLIPFISDNSADSHSDAETVFNSQYSNTMIFPFLSASAFSACDGAVDGACNVSNITAFYDAYTTNYGIGAAPYTLTNGPTPRSNYAAGLCTATINGYSDWYLPAVCEVNADHGFVSCPAGAQSISRNLTFLLGDDAAGTPETSCSPPAGTSCLAGSYWTSTTSSVMPRQLAWAALLETGGSTQVSVFKSQTLGVRCARALTY